MINQFAINFKGYKILFTPIVDIWAGANFWVFVIGKAYCFCSREIFDTEISFGGFCTVFTNRNPS